MKTSTDMNLSSRLYPATGISMRLVLAVILVSLVACKETSIQPQPPPPTTRGGADGASSAQPPTSYADVVSRVAPAVVTIRSERRVRAPQQFPFFHPFFEGRQAPGAVPEARERGLGSGVIVDGQGYLVTNHHVVDGAEDIQVVLNDNRSFSAKLVGSDPASDLAVLKIDGRDLPVLTFGNSDLVRVGDIALAIGSPLGLRQTVTAGIISAKGRTTGVSDGSFEDFLQTDAPINQGNSGGALINVVGELIGINSQILSPTGSNIGIGFAIPCNMARDVMNQLIQTGQVRRGRLGVVIQEITSDLAASLGLSELKGVLIREVEGGGPAGEAGIRPEDVILSFNGTPVNDGNTLRNKVASTQPGTEVMLTIFRDGREQQVRVTLGEFTRAGRRR